MTHRDDNYGIGWDNTEQHMTKDNLVVRIEREIILSHLSDSRPCEVCEYSILAHDWVDMDQDGFVVHCSIAERTLVVGFVTDTLLDATRAEDYS